MTKIDELASKMLDIANDGIKLDTQSTRKLGIICKTLKEIPIERIKKINLSWQQMNVSNDELPDFVALPNLSIELFPEDQG